MDFLSQTRRCFSPSALLVFALTSVITGVLAARRGHLSSVPPRAPEQAETREADPPAHVVSARAILERNPFDSRTGPLQDIDPGYNARALSAVPRCPNIQVRRVVLSDEPVWSFAEIVSRQQTALLHLGSTMDRRRLIAIEADRVRMEGEDGTCAAFLQGHGEVSAPACVASGFPLGPPCIVRRSEMVFDVAASMLDHVLEQQAALMRSARIVPETDGHGNITGIRLFGIRPDNLMGALGFENGDALQTINGFDMTQPDRALEAYAKLRCSSELRVGLTRERKKVVLEYHLW